MYLSFCISVSEMESAPRNVQVRPLSSSTMIITWEPPETPNGQVTVSTWHQVRILNNNPCTISNNDNDFYSDSDSDSRPSQGSTLCHMERPNDVSHVCQPEEGSRIGQKAKRLNGNVRMKSKPHS